MNKWSSLFLLIILSLISRPSGAGEFLQIGVYSLDPLLSFNDGPAGIVGETIQKNLARLPEIKVKYHHYPFARLMSMMERQELDMAILVAKTKEREEKFLYSEYPLWVSRPSLVIRSDSPLTKIKNLEELRGKNLGHARGSVIPDEFSKLDIKWAFRGEEKYFINALRSIYLGRLDGFFAPTFTYAKFKMSGIKNAEKYRIVALPLEGLPLYVIYQKGIDQKKKAQLEGALKSAHEELIVTQKEFMEGSRP